MVKSVAVSYTGYTMASLNKRPESPYWYIKYRDPSGKQKHHTTGFRHDIPAQTKKARIMLNEKKLVELRFEKGTNNEVWSAWVPEFLKQKYSQPSSGKTLHRYETCWRYLSVFLDEQGITRPRQMTFRHCELYMNWRKAGKPEAGVFACGHNTARFDLKILHMICVHAIKREFIQINPCANLGIKKHKSPVKPELSDEDIALIRTKLVELDMPDWMRTSFEIAIHTGCRLMETSFPLNKVDWKKGHIEFHAKGDKDYSVSIHPKLLPLLKKLKEEGRKMTCDIPSFPSKAWWLFFKKIGLRKKGVCFHCIRVTVISRLIRQGVPENIVRKIVHHASTEINRLYQRLGVDDVRPSLDALKV